MQITERDIDLMRWILEQGFMTERQVRKVFWKGVTEKSVEAYRRLEVLQKEGFLRANKASMYRGALYLVAKKGIQELRQSNRNSGLGELADVGYSSYKHDLAVTDIRAMFHEWGHTEWLSERVLSKRGGYRRIPDGMIFHKDKYIAIEYESSQKAKRRYRRIFLDYEFERDVDKVLYIMDTPKLLDKVSREASTYYKPHFVCLGDLQRDGMNAKLIKQATDFTLHEFLNFDFKT